MDEITSPDGTTIAFDRSGQGPALILVEGALGVRSDPTMAGLAEALAPRLTVLNYDRRGRGDSGDTLPYAVEREVEDIEALIDDVGGSACVFGWSSGAVLALEAAGRLRHKVTKLAMYEPPFVVDDSAPPRPADYVARLHELTAAGRRGDAVELFMKSAFHPPAEVLAMMRQDPTWTGWEKVAHTLAYDGIVMGDTQSGRPLPIERWTAVTAPTLVVTGALSPPAFHTGAEALVEMVPSATHQVLEGQDHGFDPALAPACCSSSPVESRPDTASPTTHQQPMTAESWLRRSSAAYCWAARPERLRRGSRPPVRLSGQPDQGPVGPPAASRAAWARR